jgi:alkaline phosphatase D
MKIAFTSCFSATAYPVSQPVWAQIAAQQPNALVLLGDSVYNDVPPKPDEAGHSHPSESGYQDHAFAVHLHRRYQKQLGISEFARLIAQVPTYAIWDDHDFLWNDTGAADATRPANLGKALYSANLLSCWRQALRGTQAFPASVVDARVQNGYAPPLKASSYDAWMPGYSKVDLAPGVVLHLTDNRSWRGKEPGSMLGTAQKAQIQAVITAQPTAIHLLASGSTINASSENWLKYASDVQWLGTLAGQYRILVLSGDIHKNAWHSYPTNTTHQLFEATSSGAAIDFLGVNKTGKRNRLGRYEQRFGLLDIQSSHIEVSFFDQGSLDPSCPTRRIRADFSGVS